MERTGSPRRVLGTSDRRRPPALPGCPCPYHRRYASLAAAPRARAWGGRVDSGAEVSTAAVEWEAAGGLVAEALAEVVDVPAGAPAGGLGCELGGAAAGGPDASGALGVEAGGSAHELPGQLGGVVVYEPAGVGENAGEAVYGTSSCCRSAGVPDVAAEPAGPGGLAELEEPAGPAGQAVVAGEVAAAMTDGSGEVGGGPGALDGPDASGAQPDALLDVLLGAPVESDEAVARAGPAGPAGPVGRTAVPAAKPAETWGAGS